MPLPAQKREVIPDSTDVTLVEVSCRLVGTRDVEATGIANLSLLVYPGIQVDLASIDAALAPHLPVVGLAGPPGSQQGQGPQGGQVPGWHSLALQLLAAGSRAILKRLPGPWQALSHELPPPQLLAWHRCKPVLAVGHSSSGSVLLYDTGGAAAAAAGVAGNGSNAPPLLRQPQHVLTHQLQQQVSSLAWRPVHSSMLAAGCLGGCALWSLGRLPLSAAAVHRGADGGGGGSGAAWVTFLDFKPGCRVTSLSWSPDGTKLAGSSSDTNRIMVWDAALTVGTKLRLGLVPVHLVSWSPDGNYLFAADRAGAFFMYETSTWSVRRWESPTGAAVTGAAWAPDSSVLLLSLSNSNTLVGLHLVGTPPNLTEQMLPVTLPGVSDAELPRPQQGGALAAAPAEPSSASCIASIAWDPSGNRLAVVLGGSHPAAGTVALFSTTCSPVVTCNLVGYVRPRPSGCGAPQGGEPEDEAAAAVASRELQVAFAAAPGGKAAALLSVVSAAASSGGAVCEVQNVPMYF